MRPLAILAAAVLSWSACVSASATRTANHGAGPSPAAKRPHQKCDIGPAKKIYGGTEWLVYGCTDNRTVVLVSNKGNPAFPFVFMFFPDKDGYRLYGEGTGRKEATAAAFNELKRLTPADIARLRREAEKAGKPK